MRLTRTFKNQILSLQVERVGNDLNIICQGGDTPHIGAVSLAVPYEKDNKTSVSVSTIATPHHREDEMSRKIAAFFGKRFGVSTCVACGIHYDGLEKNEIPQVEACIDALCESMADLLRDPP